MKYIKITALLLGVFGSTLAHATADDDMPLSFNYPSHRAVYDELGISFSEVASLLSHTAILKNVFSSTLGATEPAFVPPPPKPPSLSEYETPIPHKTQRMISRLEKAVLTAYLDNPSDIKLAKFLALYHLIAAGHSSSGPMIEHTIMANYFLNRARDLGGKEGWLSAAIRKTDTKLATIAASRPGVVQEENHPAHGIFHDAFFSHEENRYKAYDALLNDYVAAPNNVYTAFVTTALNLWVGGEAGYNDPTVLYNFVLGSYFSLRAISLAHQAELDWQADPVGHKRFRVASILGGFSASHRRFLAKLHKDQPAIKLIDKEHLQWFEINIVFHMFTVGYTLFEEPENFAKAQEAFDRGFLESSTRPDLITHLNRPRFTFNTLSIFVGAADFALKQGDVATARGQWLGIVPYLPNFAEWDIGADAYAHRVEHAEEISALYRNNNPKDDPVPFNVKRRKWGYDTMTCQTCHQTQRKVWSEEEKKNILLAPDDILTVGTWPEVSTTWYGALKK